MCSPSDLGQLRQLVEVIAANNIPRQKVISAAQYKRGMDIVYTRRAGLNTLSRNTPEYEAVRMDANRLEEELLFSKIEG